MFSGLFCCSEAFSEFVGGGYRWRVSAGVSCSGFEYVSDFDNKKIFQKRK
jgi:hypothetical protein